MPSVAKERGGVDLLASADDIPSLVVQWIDRTVSSN
jgi:hypothetical protein